MRILKWLAVVCALAGLMGTAASAEGLLCISTEDCVALLTADGREVVAPGAYDDLYRLTADRYALGVQTESGRLYAMCDSEGRLLTEPLYAMLSASDGAVLFRQNGLYGAMDMDGTVLIPPDYTQLTTAAEGSFLAMTGDPFDNEADEIFRISSEGEALSTSVSTDEGLARFSDNRMPYQDPATERYGYLDSEGQVAVEARFDTAEGFKDGVALASVDGLLGVIGTDGEWRIEPQFDYLEIGDGVIVGLTGRECVTVFNSDCAEVFRVEGSSLEAAVVGAYPVLLEGDVLRVYSAGGDELFEVAPQTKLSVGLDGQLILADDDWGASCASLVSPEGVRAERTDQHLIPLADGRYAFIRMNVATYYSEALDEIRYSCDYDSLRYGMMDSAGNEILAAEYLEIRALGEGRFLTVADHGLRVVDGDGTVIWQHLKEE